MGEAPEEQRAVDSIDVTRVGGEVSSISDEDLARVGGVPRRDGDGRSQENELPLATQLLSSGGADGNRHSVSSSSDELSLERLELHVMDGPLEGTTFTVGPEGSELADTHPTPW